MHRSFQLQILTWLAALAVVGAVARPSADAGLFAAAFVLGTVLLRVRESWRWTELVQRRRSAANRISSPEVRDRRILGDVLGVVIAWSAALARTRWPHVGWLPDRVDVGTLVLAAAVPSAVLLVRVVNAIRRRSRLRRLDLD